MDLGLTGKTAIVCGSSQGLGRACAAQLCAEGVSVIINGRNPDKLARVADEMRQSAVGKVTPVAADLSTEAGRAALLDACPDPDILVNNNGGPPFKPFGALAMDDVRQGVEMNMITPIALIQAVLDGMVARRFGRIVNITSVSVKMPVPGLDVSSGARAGLTGFTAGVARTVAQHNVTINQLLPGYFATERLMQGFAATAQTVGVDAEQAADQWRNQVPAQRFGSPEEFAQTCAFMCSAQAGYLTGQNILLDGGLHQAAF
jgi:3-oxoacyl-[acyl-carrier protein] reductase